MTILRMLSELDIQPAHMLSTALVLVVSYVGYKLLRTSIRNRFTGRKISAIRAAFEFKKSNLKTSLAPEAEKWKQIVSLPFRDLVKRLQSGDIKTAEALRAYQFKAVQCSDKNNPITDFLNGAETIVQDLDKSSVKKPLHGVPCSIKECYLLKGTEATGGHTSYLGKFTHFESAPLVQFLEGLGCVPFVKTNVPQAMLSFDSENAIYGVTTNPYDIFRGPGGSSSGEGSLIGGGGSPLGIGNDVGGSLRIPAAWSGCTSLKPTLQRMLSGGTCPGEKWPRMMFTEFLACGFLAREVDALVAVHRLLYSEETFQKFRFSSMVPIPFREDVFASKKKLKIAYWDSDGVTETVPSVKRAIKEAKQVLQAKGHELVAWKPYGVKEAFLLICEALTVDGAPALIDALNADIAISYANKTSYASMRMPYWFKRLLAFVTRPLSGNFPSDVILSLRTGAHPDDMNRMYTEVRDFRRAFASAFGGQSFDAILCPAFACPALPLLSPRDGLGAATYTCLFNALNWPAGVLPVTKVNQADEEAMSSYPGNRDMYHRTIKAGMMHDTVGLPVAVQLAAPAYCEEIVLRLMHEIETAVNYKM